MERNWVVQSPTDEHCWDVLGGYDRKVKNDSNSLLGRSKANEVLISMQCTILLHAIKKYEHCTFILGNVTLLCVVYLSLYTHWYPIKGERIKALGPSV